MDVQMPHLNGIETTRTLRAQRTEARVPILTTFEDEREREILAAIVDGLSNPEIARRLGLAEGTVTNYVSRILQKTGSDDRTQAALRARDLGLIRPRGRVTPWDDRHFPACRSRWQASAWTVRRTDPLEVRMSLASNAVPDAGRTPVSLRSALILLALALLGVASLLLSDLDLGVLADQVDLAPAQLRLLILVQPAILSLLAVVVGWRTSGRTGLGLPLLEGGLGRVTTGGLAAAGTVALVGAATLLLYAWLTSQVVVMEGAEAISTSLATRLLYGGITEEVLLRWGMMGLFAWLLIRVTRRPAGRTRDLIVIANVMAAVLFAVGHFPALSLVPGAEPVHYLLSFVANAGLGVLFGWTFARHGLEYAILAHGGTHLLAFLVAIALA